MKGFGEENTQRNMFLRLKDTKKDIFFFDRKVLPWTSCCGAIENNSSFLRQQKWKQLRKRKYNLVLFQQDLSEKNKNQILIIFELLFTANLSLNASQTKP